MAMHTDPIIIAAAICLADWGCAMSHMAFDVQRRKPVYDAYVPLWGDFYHFVAALRYIPMLLLARLAYGPFYTCTFLGWSLPVLRIEIHTNAFWWIGTAVVNFLGWQVLKRIHGKQWGFHRLLNKEDVRA